MKINDVEQLLGISKANIRFYEKQHLLSPARSANGYREYSDEDILRLKEIIILRKLGISVEDIARIQSGELNLQSAMESNIVQLENQLKSLNGALKISKQIAADPASHFSIEHYWNEIHNEEQKGNAFLSIIHDYRTFMLPYVQEFWTISENVSPITNIMLFVLISILVSCLLGNEPWHVIHTRIVGFIIMVLGLLPIYILSKVNHGFKDILSKFSPATVVIFSLFLGFIIVPILLLLRYLL